MSDIDTLWAAKLHLSSGKPATLLDAETIRAICEAYVAAVEREPNLMHYAWRAGAIAAGSRPVKHHSGDFEGIRRQVDDCMVTKVTP